MTDQPGFPWLLQLLASLPASSPVTRLSRFPPTIDRILIQLYHSADRLCPPPGTVYDQRFLNTRPSSSSDSTATLSTVFLFLAGLVPSCPILIAHHALQAILAYRRQAAPLLPYTTTSTTTTKHIRQRPKRHRPARPWSYSFQLQRARCPFASRDGPVAAGVE